MSCQNALTADEEELAAWIRRSYSPDVLAACLKARDVQKTELNIALFNSVVNEKLKIIRGRSARASRLPFNSD